MQSFHRREKQEKKNLEEGVSFCLGSRKEDESLPCVWRSQDFASSGPGPSLNISCVGQESSIKVGPRLKIITGVQTSLEEQT